MIWLFESNTPLCNAILHAKKVFVIYLQYLGSSQYNYEIAGCDSQYFSILLTELSIVNDHMFPDKEDRFL